MIFIYLLLAVKDGDSADDESAKQLSFYLVSVPVVMFYKPRC